MTYDRSPETTTEVRPRRFGRTYPALVVPRSHSGYRALAPPLPPETATANCCCSTSRRPRHVAADAQAATRSRDRRAVEAGGAAPVPREGGTDPRRARRAGAVSRSPGSTRSRRADRRRRPRTRSGPARRAAPRADLPVPATDRRRPGRLLRCGRVAVVSLDLHLSDDAYAQLVRDVADEDAAPGGCAHIGRTPGDALTPRVDAITGLGYPTVLREIRAGRLRAAKRRSRWIIRQDWFDAWLDAGPPPRPHDSFSGPDRGAHGCGNPGAPAGDRTRRGVTRWPAPPYYGDPADKVAGRRATPPAVTHEWRHHRE